MTERLPHPDGQLQHAKEGGWMKKQIICVIMLSNLDYTTGYAVREFFFAICSLDIEHTEEKLNKEKTVSEVGT